MGVYTEKQPKCMTDISANDSILSRQLKIISESDIRDVIITTGYFDDVLVDYCNSLGIPLNFTFVKNPLFNDTNYIYSIYSAKDYFSRSDIVLMHGDMVFSRKVFKDVLKCETSCMTVSSTVPLPKKDFKAEMKNGKIEKIGLEFYDNALSAQPLYKLKAVDWKIWLDKIIEFCENGNRKCYAENAFNEVSNKCHIYPLDVKDELCNEIDNPDDLVTVSASVAKTEKIEKL